MKTEYPLIAEKKKFNHGLSIHLDPTGYFRLDKASFFIDDTFSVLFSYENRRNVLCQNAERRVEV